VTLFVSYTRSDDAVVRVLKNDLERVGRSVWLDTEISGGEQWWQEIIQQIRGAEVFLFALSKDSWGSQPCLLELSYAKQLGVPIVPVQVGPVESLKISIAKKQIIDYRQRSADVVVALVARVTELCAQPWTLPDPLPEPPKMPFEYLFRLSSLMEVQEISRKNQQQLITELRQWLKTEHDEIARNDILLLLKELRVRNELTVPHAAEIDEILSGIHSTKVPPAGGSTRLSPADTWRRPKPDADGPVSGSPSRTAPPEGSSENGGQGQTSTHTSDPPSGSGSDARTSGRSAGPGECPAPQERVAPAWLTDLVTRRGLAETGAGATVADSEPHLWPRPSDTPAPARARKWWLEEQSSREPPAEPMVETPTPSAQPPTSPPPSPPTTGMSRKVAALVIAGLLVAIVVLILLSP
jgi:hypothetical protein